MAEERAGSGQAASRDGGRGGAAPGDDFATCCSDFYASEAVRLLLGDSFHPGGVDLTRELLELARVEPGAALLDVGGGMGTSAELAARELGCRVTLVDRAAANLDRARDRIERAGLGDPVAIRQADVHALPFPAASFDVVLCECAFSTFTDKPAAAAEMLRVLRRGGRLALSDVTLEAAALPPDLETLLARVACLADALPQRGLIALLERAGFSLAETRDSSWALTEMAERVRRRLVALKVAGKLGAIDTGGYDIDEGKRLADRALELIEDGGVLYVAVVALREA
ncbi:MAG: methyltransferase domain-containing protein [Thermoleophilia bacterium]